MLKLTCDQDVCAPDSETVVLPRVEPEEDCRNTVAEPLKLEEVGKR